MLTAPRMVRMDRAVRPCLPITLPTSLGATRSRRTVLSSRSTASTTTASGFVDEGAGNFGYQLLHVVRAFFVGHFLAPLEVVGVTLSGSRHTISNFARKTEEFSSSASKLARNHNRGSKACGISGLGCGWFDSLGNQLGYPLRELCAFAGPVVDALALQVN